MLTVIYIQKTSQTIFEGNALSIPKTNNFRVSLILFHVIIENSFKFPKLTGGTDDKKFVFS